MERRAPRVLPFWAAVIAVLGWLALVVWLFVGPHAPTAREIAWSDFKTAIAERRIESVVVSPATVRGTFRPDASGAKESFVTVRVEDPAVVDELVRAGVRIEGEPAPGEGAGTWLRIGLVALLIAFVVSGFRRGAAGPIAAPFGKSHARVYMEKEVGVSFADVAGVDEAIEELKEVITFLTEPEKFRKLGGKIPKGILLVGPPGTGKTLLARAVAGEANVPFFSISGSEFVELFVGVGAARVRDLFRQAKEKAPCIIFIDELDALGKTRVAGPMAHEEREQTLNQLLVELDGFDPRGGVVLMAATNRPEILDPALLRAGRFDRRIAIDRPEKAGRRAILSLHVRNVPLAPDADLDVIAGMTPGMAGADLANLVNEAALLAVRRGKDRVGMSELVEAVERVVAGLEKRTRVLSPPERRRVAVHELGHALVALSLPGADPVRKISIIPRGVSLGHTLQTPAEDRFLTTQRELEARVAVLLGGRAAEQLVFGEVSTGAHDDLTRASEIAEAMVREFGMSRRLGARAFPREPSFEGFLRAEAVPPAAETAQEIETEIAWILDQQEAHATRILAARRAQLEAATGLLLERETIGADELARLETPPAVTRAPGEASPLGNAARTA